MLPFYTFAQNAQNGTKHGYKNNDITPLITSIYEKTDSILKLLNSNISNNHQQIPDNPQGCQNDSAKYETVIKKKNDTITRCTQKIDSLNSKIDNLNSKINTLTSQKDSLEKYTTFFNETIFKQCLLYPLEGRYDSIFISECKQCLKDMKIQESHPKLYNTYYDLLNDYKNYNDQVKTFLVKQKISVDMKGELTGDFKEKAKRKLKNLDYYKNFYSSRNTPPYKSIPYLDEVIDEFLSVLNSNKLNGTNMQELIEKLEPKTNQNK